MGGKNTTDWKELSTRIARMFEMIAKLVPLNKEQDLESYESLMKQLSEDTSMQDKQIEMNKKVSEPVFRSIVDWDGLRAMDILFLEGLLPSSPSHDGPLYIDSQTQKRKYQVLVQLGFLTLDSQPGMCSRDEFQRAYINGFISTRKTNVDKLIKRLDKAGLLYSIGYPDGTNMHNFYRFIGNMEQARDVLEPPSDTYVTSAGYYPLSSRNYIDSSDGRKIPLTVAWYEDKDLDGRAWYLSTAVKENWFTKEFDSTWYNVIEQTNPIDEPIAHLAVIHPEFCTTDLADKLIHVFSKLSK